MRRRTLARFVLASSLLATPIAVMPTAAHAADTTNTVTSVFGLPSNWTSLTEKCDSVVAGTKDIQHVDGPETPPAGTGSLKISVHPGDEVYLSEGFPSGTDSETLSGWLPQAYQYPIADGDTPMTASADINLFNGAGNIYYRLSVSLAGATTWAVAAHDVLAFTHWYKLGQAAELGNGSYASWISNVESGSRSLITGVTYHFRNCAGTTTQSYAIDDDSVSFGTAGSKVTTTTDFEPSPATALTGKLTKGEVPVAGATTPVAHMAIAGQTVTGQTVTLWSKPAGAADFTQIDSKTVDASGNAIGAALAPTVNTAYQWRYATDGTFLDAVSKTFSVKVDRAVTMFVVKHAVKVGKPVQVTGTAKPKQAGLKVKLYRQKGKKKIKLAKATLKPSGFYSISKVLPKGNYKLFTTVAGNASYAASSSKIVTVSVAK